MKQDITLEGKHNLGLMRKEKLRFTIENDEKSIVIKDDKGKVLISFAPFFDGGSVWLSDFNSIIMDREHWEEDKKDGKFKMLWKEEQAIANVSTSQIIQWKKDSETLQKIREARTLLEEVRI